MRLLNKNNVLMVTGIVCVLALYACKHSETGQKKFTKGESIFKDTFIEPGKWSTAKGAVFKAGKPFNVLSITNENSSKKNADNLTVQRDVYGKMAKTEKKSISVTRDVTAELKKWAGYEVEVSAEVKAENVPVSKIPWEGVRVVLNYTTPIARYGNSGNGLSGTFDWKTVTFKGRIPSDLVSANMSLGLISNGGKMQVRNLKIKISGVKRTAHSESGKRPMYKGHKLPRLRGLNNFVLSKVDDVTKNWKANVIKYNMCMPSIELSDSEVDAYVDKHLKEFDKAIKHTRPTGAYLVFQISVGNKGTRGKENKTDYFYIKPGYADRFVKIWDKIAKYYKGEKVIWGFELLNESCFRIPTPQKGCPDYEMLMEQASLAINKADPERTIIIQPEEWWGVNAFNKLRPINAENIVYAIHFYAPFKLTHQNLHKEGKPVPYPGMFRGVMWNKETLRKALKPAIEFQKAYNVHMFVSEFSCVRWAPGSDKWLNDSIDLFEEYGWDWMFHDIYGWNGWTPELGPDRNNHKRVKNNPREVVLKKAMANNQFVKK